MRLFANHQIDKSVRKSRLRPARSTPTRRLQRSPRVENLEQRSLLAVLVSEALSGTADTTIGGTVYNDLDGNGVRNGGENGVEGWTVYLDLDNSGTLNTDAVGDLA